MSNPNDLTSVIGAVAWMLSPIQERRLFAAMAMLSIANHPRAFANDIGPRDRAKWAVMEADALIAELAK